MSGKVKSFPVFGFIKMKGNVDLCHEICILIYYISGLKLLFLLKDVRPVILCILLFLENADLKEK